MTTKPIGLSGWYMYDTLNSQAGLDSAIIRVTAKVNNGGVIDTVAFGQAYLKSAPVADGWVPFTVTIDDWQPGVDPETVQIIMMSSDGGFCSMSSSGECLYLYVDDLQLTTPTGIFDQDDLFEEINVYPNPATESITIDLMSERAEEITIVDMQGRTVYQSNNMSPQRTLDISTWSNGLYIVRCGYGHFITARKKLLIQN